MKPAEVEKPVPPPPPPLVPPPLAFILIGGAPLKARRVPLTVPMLISVIAFQSGGGSGAL